MNDPGLIAWQQTIIGGTLQDQWFAYIPSRGNACFASISLMVDRTTWNCNVFPKGKQPGVQIFHFNAKDIDHAKGWIDRWTKHHWRSVSPAIAQPK